MLSRAVKVKVYALAKLLATPAVFLPISILLLLMLFELATMRALLPLMLFELV